MNSPFAFVFSFLKSLHIVGPNIISIGTSMVILANGTGLPLEFLTVPATVAVLGAGDDVGVGDGEGVGEGDDDGVGVGDGDTLLNMILCTFTPRSTVTYSIFVS